MAIWGSTGEHTAPEDANINAGFVSGESLARPWLNWVLWVLHTVYVTGIYYMTQIRPLTSGGTITVRNFDGTVTYMTVDTTTGTGKVTADRGLLLGNNAERASRMWFEDGPTVRVRDNQLLGYQFTSNGGVVEVHRILGNLHYYLNPAVHYIDIPLKLPYSTTDGGFNGAKPHYKFKLARLATAHVVSAASTANPDLSCTLELIRYKNQVNSEAYIDREEVLLTDTEVYNPVNPDLDLSTAYMILTISDTGLALDFEDYSYAIRISVNNDDAAARFFIFPDFYYELIQYSSGYLQ